MFYSSWECPQGWYLYSRLPHFIIFICLEKHSYLFMGSVPNFDCKLPTLIKKLMCALLNVKVYGLQELKIFKICTLLCREMLLNCYIKVDKEYSSFEKYIKSFFNWDCKYFPKKMRANNNGMYQNIHYIMD